MNKVWALSDIHLQGNSKKSMEKYGSIWVNHEKIILDNVNKLCSEGDILLIPGDITWSNKIENAHKDFEYLSQFPCRIIMCPGNHDQWSKVSPEILLKYLPKNVTWIQDVCFRLGNLAISGCCFWEFQNVFPWPNHCETQCNREKQQREARRDFNKALEILPNESDLIKILMLHFPPIPYDARPYTFSTEIASKNIDYCVFGHAHNVSEYIPACDAKIDGTQYYLCSCDWLKMKPIKVCEFESDSRPYIINGKGKITYL